MSTAKKPRETVESLRKDLDDAIERIATLTDDNQFLSADNDELRAALEPFDLDSDEQRYISGILKAARDTAEPFRLHTLDTLIDALEG